MSKILFFVLFFGPVLVYGQYDISGHVRLASDGSALPGINVTVKGTKSGTVTDIQGYFKISVSNGNSTIVFSFVGLETQEILIDGDKKLEVDMTSDTKQLGKTKNRSTPGKQQRVLYPYSESNRYLLASHFV